MPRYTYMPFCLAPAILPRGRRILALVLYLLPSLYLLAMLQQDWFILQNRFRRRFCRRRRCANKRDAGCIRRIRLLFLVRYAQQRFPRRVLTAPAFTLHALRMPAAVPCAGRCACWLFVHISLRALTCCRYV